MSPPGGSGSRKIVLVTSLGLALGVVGFAAAAEGLLMIEASLA